ncbi:MAG: hypothetical protein OXR66_07490 [Candidatus Woesearchaeota archaeon]|nr:hypothetical protein [Candidatus Woesearchaeota archaeon]
MAKDGTGKSITLTASILGAVRQAPYLIRDIVACMPEIQIYMDPRKEFHRELIIEDLQRIDGALLGNVCFEDRIGDFFVDLASDNYAQNHSGMMQIHVDPLKFEYRVFLSDRERDTLRETYGVTNERVIVAGSLREQEIDPLVQAVRYANQITPTLGILVPRYPEFLTPQWLSERVVFVIEKGGLQELYAIADVTFIGDTWHGTEGGGQNPLEPAFYDIPIISGPHWSNNMDAFEGLQHAGLLRTVNNQGCLNEALASTSPLEKSVLERTRAFLDSKQGAAMEAAQEIQRRLYH